MPEEHQYPPLQPASEPAPPEEFENQLFPEPLHLAVPIQVHIDSPEPSVSPKLNQNQETSLSRQEQKCLIQNQKLDHLGYRSVAVYNQPLLRRRFFGLINRIIIVAFYRNYT